MKLHLILPFIGYLFKEMFSSIVYSAIRYRRLMQRDFGFSIFVGCALTMLFTAVITLISAAFFEMPIVRNIFFAVPALCVTFMVYTGLSIMFNNFLEERQRLFNIIKD